MPDHNKKTGSPDDFWDLSSLVPKRKTPPLQRTVRSTAPVEIRMSTPAVPNAAQDVPLSERYVSPRIAADLQAAPKPERTYTPEGTLIRAVRIYPWKNEYTYYDQFCRHARQLFPREGKECPEVDFFSYMPQYSQLSMPQLQYYLWWRTNFRRGVCLPAAYSYLLLYLYELINLEEKQLTPQTGQENMLRLWLSYREEHPRLDALIREWLCDYSLLHGLNAPRLDPTLYRTLLSGCRLKEFYVPAGESGNAVSTAILLFCNNYDYTKSKFYKPETKADYDRVLSGAIDVAVQFLRKESGAALTDTGGISTVSRDSFSGAICSWQLKRRIEVDYTSFSHTHDLRYVMTDVLKYAENALRAGRGIKSRLSIYAISVPLRERLDAYLAAALPPRKAHTSVKKTEIPDYERQYDLPTAEISPERAAAIEADSWQTTKRLVEAFAEPDMEISPQTGGENAVFAPPKPVEAPPVPETAPQGDSPLKNALGKWAAFLPLAQSGDRAAQQAFARQTGRMLDAIADEINTVAGDILGDILLEDAGGYYTVIEDYLETLIEEGIL